MTLDAAKQATSLNSGNLLSAGNGRSFPQGPPKDLVPVSENVVGDTVRGRIFECCGPTGPCLLEMGHPGDHVRPVVKAEPAGSVFTELERLRLENAELLACLRIARPLLADVHQIRGGALRRSLLSRIDRVVEG